MANEDYKIINGPVTEAQLNKYNETQREKYLSLYDDAFFEQLEQSFSEESKQTRNIGDLVITVFTKHTSEGLIDDKFFYGLQKYYDSNKNKSKRSKSKKSKSEDSAIIQQPVPESAN